MQVCIAFLIYLQRSILPLVCSLTRNYSYLYNMQLRLVCTVVLLLTLHTVFAQIQISVNGKPLSITQAQLSYTYTDAATMHISDTATHLTVNDWQRATNDGIPISYQPKCIWLKIPMNALLAQNIHFASIANPHINKLACWLVDSSNRIIKHYGITGDNLVFQSRPLPSTDYTLSFDGIPLNNKLLIIAADKRYTKLDIPIVFSSEAYYIHKTQTNKLIVGLFLGIGCFILLFNVYLYGSLKQQVYFWYSIYLLLILFYIATDVGLPFKYLYPNLPLLNDVIRPASFAVSLVPLLFFYNSFLNLKITAPQLLSFNKRLLISYVALFVIAVSSTIITGNYQVQQFWIYTNRIVAPLLLITILAQAIYCYLRQIQFAIFAVTSFTVLVIFFSIYSFHQNGLIVSNSFTSHSHYWGLAIEASIIAFSLAWRYKTYKEEAERLLIENFRIQDNILKETAQWQEKELERISSLLHDTVGANIGLLRLHADAMPLTEDGRGVLANQITALGNEIRQMSHALSPLKLQHHGLQVALQDLVQQIKQSTSLNLQLEWLGNKKALDFQYEIIIYRTVQEALQNMLKHAHAKEAIVQVLLEDDLISIYIEDDGVGSHTNQPFDGIGLKSIEKLVQLLNGTFQIKTSPQAGFSLSVEFKTLNHESLSSRHR
ncbi:MAG TPA: hypothetical protein DCL43_09675 [Chitinophagaceae bacterium]|nr:hypothetical protein [Chitinophagaceae bacterium]HAN39576.1 hypothetical protein [Chitinophagaceae bacterium]